MKALITAQFDQNIIDKLRSEMEVVHTGWGVSEKVLSENELISELKDAEILITEIETCSEKVIDQCPRLEFIGCCRNNPVNIDVAAANKRKIPVIYGPGRNERAVAEITIAMMIMISRQIGRALLDVRSSRWNTKTRFSYLEYKGNELFGKTVGIIGMGAIGRSVKSLCKAMGMRILVHDPLLERKQDKREEITIVTLTELLSQSDFVTLHVPDTPDTLGMIGNKELSLMKPSAFIINTARGRHVEEKALYQSLKTRQIAGAALDVFYKEPLPLDHPFFELDNIILLPHIGGATFEVIKNHSTIMYEQLQRYLKRESLSYLKNPEIYVL